MTHRKTINLFTNTLLFLTGLLLFSCTTVKQIAVGRDLRKSISNSDTFDDYFFGFALYDIDDGIFINEINADKYFTPASNVKILTLAAFLNQQREKIPSFLMGTQDGRTILRPLGDPTFLHPVFEYQPVLRQLSEIPSDTLWIDISAEEIEHYGPGWAWSDYWYYYQPRRNLMPLYGNVLHADITKDLVRIIPDFFRPYTTINSTSNYREPDANIFHLGGKIESGDTVHVEIPFITNRELEIRLLGDTLQKVVMPIDFNGQNEWDTLYNGYSFQALAQMMQVSDNFLAEQLLINSRLTQGYKTEISYFDYLTQDLFKDLSQPLIWIDGSGLSRYNMVTPRTMVEVLEKIYYQLTWKQITEIFPTGGQSGTIKNWYNGDEPYVYAKTGTLRHNHCLSGFIQTRSGKQLIFSIMNNHYTSSSTVIKNEMQKLLELIRDNY